MKNFRYLLAVAAGLWVFSSIAAGSPEQSRRGNPELAVAPASASDVAPASASDVAPASTSDVAPASTSDQLNIPPIPVELNKLPVPLPAPEEFPVAHEISPRQWADSIMAIKRDATPDSHFSRLTEEDFREVAEELGVEVAAIKAVVDIEAGRAHEGFYKPGKPIINFDLSMYQKFAPKRGVSLTSARKKAPVIFSRPDTRRYGSYQAAQYARLDAARAINEESALESCFWGMFQIGGFNWKLCGCSSVEEFVDRMSRSERDQLELFAALIRNCNMLVPLQKKQWLAFALKYNGPRAQARGYHTKMAAAYKRHGG